MRTKSELLENYRRDLLNIRNNLNLLPEEFEPLLQQSLKNLSKKRKQVSKARVLIISFFSLIILLLLYVLLNVHQPTSSIVLRNVQGLTYPALKVVRSLTVPILKLFPSLTNLYDETCLVENPYFYVNDMECWPCQNVHSVINLTNIKTDFSKIGDGTPFLTKVHQNEVTLESLQHIFKDFPIELYGVKSTYSKISTVKDLILNPELPKDAHIQWRINKMLVAKKIRKLFKRPPFVPERRGQSVERFIIVDGPSAKSYSLPNTECGNVFLTQGSGERAIVFMPSKECQSYCRPVSIILKPSYGLTYNWYYWRPISLPVENSTSPSVTYMSSYC